MNAQSQTLPPLSSRMGEAPRRFKPAHRGSGGTPRTVPPIEQRFTGPIGPAVDRDRGNPFGPVPGIARGTGQLAKGARTLILSPANMVLAFVMVAAAAVTLAAQMGFSPERVVFHLQYAL